MGSDDEGAVEAIFEEPALCSKQITQDEVDAGLIELF